MSKLELPNGLTGAKGGMTSRERMLAAIERKPVDRIPTDIWATGEVWTSLAGHFGSASAARKALHIDGFACGGSRYVGPSLPADGLENEWGVRNRAVQNEQGTYWEQSVFPLAAARTIDDLEAYRWPHAEWYDPSAVAEALREPHRHQATQVGYMAPFYFHNMLRGMEASLIDPLDDADFTHHLLTRITDVFISQHRRLFEAAEGLIDVTQVTDDYGSQTGPMISLDVFRTFYRPQLQRCIDLAKEFGIKVFHHDDGAMKAFLPDLIEMGIDILNPIQHVCPGMDRAELKAEFGDRLCFHSAVENQRILPFGTPEEVRTEVRACIDTLASDGTGFILCPCHNLQAGTPVANIIAMYDEAHTYGEIG